jgi:hypothetical protein
MAMKRLLEALARRARRIKLRVPTKVPPGEKNKRLAEKKMRSQTKQLRTTIV